MFRIDEKSLMVQYLVQNLSSVFELRWFRRLLDEISNHQYFRDEVIQSFIGGDFISSVFEMRWFRFRGLLEETSNHHYLR